MNRRRKLLILAACGVVVAVCFFCLRESEPSYKGRKLSEWLDGIGLAIQGTSTNEIDPEKAMAAVRAIGATNALPFLRAWANGSPVENWIQLGIQQMPKSIRTSRFAVRFDESRSNKIVRVVIAYQLFDIDPAVIGRRVPRVPKFHHQQERVWAGPD